MMRSATVLGLAGLPVLLVFLFAAVVLVVTAGVSSVAHVLPGRTLAGAALAALAGWAVVARPAPVDYPPLDHSRLVRLLEERIQPDDALLLNTSGAYLTAHYGPWPARAARDASPQGFAVEIERPLTVTIPRGAEHGEGSLAAARGLLQSERPDRVFLFSTRRPIDALETLVLASGYVESRRDTSRVSTFLVEYAREVR